MKKKRKYSNPVEIDPIVHADIEEYVAGNAPIRCKCSAAGVVLQMGVLVCAICGEDCE